MTVDLKNLEPYCGDCLFSAADAGFLIVGFGSEKFGSCLRCRRTQDCLLVRILKFPELKIEICKA